MSVLPSKEKTKFACFYSFSTITRDPSPYYDTNLDPDPPKQMQIRNIDQ